MEEYIYALIHKILEDFKIGSTKQYIKRIPAYKTCFSKFDNGSHDLWVFKIIESKYSCYQLDDLINKLSSKYNYPFIKYDGTGGTEFYEKDDINKLCKFFNKIDVKYELKKIDIDEFKNP